MLVGIRSLHCTTFDDSTRSGHPADSLRNMVDQELLLEGYCFILQLLHAADPFGTTIRKPKLDNTLRERLMDQIVRGIS